MSTPKLQVVGMGKRGIVEVETLPTEEISSQIFFRTPEGVYWYDGKWNKVVKETDLTSALDNAKELLNTDIEKNATDISEIKREQLAQNTDINTAKENAASAKSTAETLNDTIQTAHNHSIMTREKLSEEVLRAKDAEHANEMAIANEASRAKQAEQANATAIENLKASKQDNLSFDGVYNKDTNKAATVETVLRLIAEIIAGADTDFDTLKELADWLATHGAEAAEMNSAIKANTDNITKNAQDILAERNRAVLAESINATALETLQDTIDLAVDKAYEAKDAADEAKAEAGNIADEVTKSIEPELKKLDENKQDNLSFDGAYNAETNKVATVSTVTAEKDRAILAEKANADAIEAENKRATEAEENLANTKQDNLVFDGVYNAETNKVATVQTIINKVAELIAGAPEDFDTLKELADWLATHGAEAAEMNSAIKANSENIAKEAERATKAEEALGGRIDTVDDNLDNYLEKGTPPTEGRAAVYGIDKDGTQKMFTADAAQMANKVAMTDAYGCLYVADPRQPNNAASRQYVDNNFVKNTDIADSSKAGVIEVSVGNTAAVIYRTSSSRRMSLGNMNSYIDEKTTENAIRNKDLDYAVKVGVTTNAETLTDEEKDLACGWLGASREGTTEAGVTVYEDEALDFFSTNGTIGLAYNIQDPTYGYCVGMGESNDSYIEIGEMVRGVPIGAISANAFENDLRIQKVTILDGIEWIENSAFASCYNLHSVVIPKSIIGIGKSAFHDCAELTDVYYAGTEEEWNAIAIGEENEALTNATIHYNYSEEV